MPKRHRYIRTDEDKVDGKVALSFIDKFHRLGLFSDLERQCGDAQDIYTYYCKWHWLDNLHEKAVNETSDEGREYYYVPEDIESLLELASAIDHFKEEALYTTDWAIKLERGIKAIDANPIHFYSARILQALDVSSALENYGEHRKAVYDSILESIRFTERLTEEYPIEKEIGGY